MNVKLTAACLLAASLAAPMMPAQAAPSDDSAHPTVFVADSAITAKIKTKLATQHLASLAHIKVDTDDKGVVYLSGFAHSQSQVDMAGNIARDTDGVRAVQNNIRITPDD